VNWGWLLLRSIIALTICGHVVLSQRFWYRSLWRVTAIGEPSGSSHGSLMYISVLILTIGTAIDGFSHGARPPFGSSKNAIEMLVGLWLLSALFAYFALKAGPGIEVFRLPCALPLGATLHQPPVFCSLRKP